MQNRNNNNNNRKTNGSFLAKMLLKTIMHFVELHLIGAYPL